MKEIQWQLPLGRYQSMLNPLAVVFKGELKAEIGHIAQEPVELRKRP